MTRNVRSTTVVKARRPAPAARDAVLETSAAPRCDAAAVAPSEATVAHTRILQCSLAVPESRAYWAHVTPGVPQAARGIAAFEERWFGAKSLARVRRLLTNLAARFDAFPEALALLRALADLDPASRQAICHWHLMLSDPIYRAFAGRFLVERRRSGLATVDRDAARRFIEEEFPGRWGPATCRQFAQKLLAAASEAGLASAKVDPRKLLEPRVTDAALRHLLRLLRGVRIDGHLLDNVYLVSVGLTGEVLDRRLRALPGLRVRRSGDVAVLEWDEP